MLIVGAINEQKTFGILGGIAMLVGPTLLIFDLIGQISVFADGMDSFSTGYDGTIFFGIFSGGGDTLYWGLWVGYFLANVGGVMGLIGGILV